MPCNSPTRVPAGRRLRPVHACRARAGGRCHAAAGHADRRSGDGKERTYDIPAADGVTIDRKTQVMLVRYGTHVYAMAMACPHEQAAVKWVKKDGRFQCTKHDLAVQA